METNLGLIKYDGIEAKKYDITRKDTTIASNDYVRALYVDSFGELWIGANSGLNRYKAQCDCIEHFPIIVDNSPMGFIRSITEDHNNNVWIGTLNGDLFFFDRILESFAKPLQNNNEALSILNDRIGNLMVDDDNRLWIGTSSGIILFDIANKIVNHFTRDTSDPNSLSDNRIRSIYQDNLGQILIGTFHSGLHFYDPVSEKIKRIIDVEKASNKLIAPYTENTIFGEPPHVNIIHQDQKGNYWIGTTGAGVNQINLKKGTLRNYHFDLINPQILWAFCEDKQGIIWLGGGMGAGLLKADIYSGTYHLNNSITNVEIAYESPLNPGVLWVMTQENGLGKIDLKTTMVKSFIPDANDKSSITHNWVRSVHQQDKNTLWLGLGNGGAYGHQDGNGGINKMDLTTEKFTSYEITRDDDGLEDYSYSVYSISEDRLGNLWIGTGPGGIFTLKKDQHTFKPVKIIDENNHTGNSYLNITCVDSLGNIWASNFANEGTLYLYDHQKEAFIPFLTGFKMSNLIIDHKGWYLISTWESGIIHLNPEDLSYTQYTTKDGLPSIEALDIVNGENGIFWLSTRLGPAKLNTNTGKITTVGLPKLRYNYRILKSSNNRLYVGSYNGLYSFSPDQDFNNPFPPQLSISEFFVSDSNYLSNHNEKVNLVFPYNQNDIAFKYSALHFSDPKKNQYKYKLKPINEKWIEAGTERTARYFNLPPGDYIFEVISSNSYGVWNEEPEILSFTIKPSIWFTWWAYLLYAILIIFVIERIYRFRLSKKLADAESQRLKELDKLKNSFFTNITHEFRTPLTVIKGMSGSIKSDLQKQRLESIEHSLEIIDRNSNGLLNLINEMLDLAKIESGNMELNLIQADIIPYVKYLTQSFQSLAEEKHIVYRVDCKPGKLEMDIDINKFTAIISNLISNAIKFTCKEGFITVTVDTIKKESKQFLSIAVTDTGRGIIKEEINQIFEKFYQAENSSSSLQKGTGIGLSIVKEFTQLMKGSVHVESIESKGSSFHINLPISNNATLIDSSELVSSSSSFELQKPSSTETINLTGKSKNQDAPIVLIIEDNSDVALYIKTCLADNYIVLHASNGDEGLNVALEKIPDIIISDVMMPVKDGFEVCEFLKTNELTDHIPIILLTAKASFEDRLTGLSFGADAYLTKPFEKAELITRIDQLILLRRKILSKFEKTGVERLIRQNVKNSESRYLSKIIQHIHENISSPGFGAAQLAQLLLISESQLYRKLKAISGKSSAIFIRSIRLQKARELIETTQNTISEIAYEVGFNDPSYFSRVYKEEFGHSPTEKV